MSRTPHFLVAVGGLWLALLLGGVFCAAHAAHAAETPPDMKADVRADTMVETARTLLCIPGKTVVLTGSIQPARFRNTDAVFNIGLAIGAVQSLPPGIYIAMNGRILDPSRARKDLERNLFEEVP